MALSMKVVNSRRQYLIRSFLNSYLHKSQRRLCATEQKPKYERRIFSGIQPTGIPHIGNYLGAIHQWVQLQERFNSVIISVVDLHSITIPQNPEQLRKNIRDMTICLLACGIDPKKSIIFNQSSVSEHAQLCWVLGCLTTMPRLEHLPQWKQKSEAMKEVPLGLFTYPVLQSADILLYRATDVPVGDDQVKHVELTRHLAKLFNNQFGELFPKPRILTGELKRLKSLRKPSQKMSKSEPDPRSRIELTDSDDAIRDKVRKSVTDSDPSISYDVTGRPGVSNLIDLHAAVTAQEPEEIVESALLMDTVEYKDSVAAAVIDKVGPIREEIVRLRSERGYVDEIISDGNARAKAIARETFANVKRLMGLS